MKGKRVLIILLTLCFLFAALGCVAWWNTARNYRKINDFSYQNHDCNSDVISYTTTNGTTVKLVFGKTAVQVANSYTLETRSDRLEIAAFIVCALREKEIYTTQTLTDYLGELTFHYTCYRLKIKQKQAAHADLEYVGDTRSTVRIASKILAVFGF